MYYDVPCCILSTIIFLGNGSVSMAAYFNTLRVLGLHDDFLKLAADDSFGRKLQDLELLGKL
jgi:hypothetical protein